MVSVRITGLVLLLAWFNGLSCLAHSASASGHAKFGLIGYGIHMWQPPCAYACRRLIALSPLECSVQKHHEGRSLGRRHGGDKDDFSTSPDCFNHDKAFLLSLAWCMHQHCSDAHGAEPWRLERFWAIDAVPTSHHAPNYTYVEAIELCNGGLEPVLSQGHHLKEPSSVSEDDYAAMHTYIEDYSRVEVQSSHYGVFLVFTMVALPLFLALGQHLLAAASPALERKLLAHVVQPALLGRRHLVSLPYEIGMAPLRGQAVLIALVIFLNTTLSVVHYDGSMPSFKYNTESDAFWTYLSNRAAYLSFANLVVVFLYSGRNNPLIYLTGWHYGTFILLHRWVAYICVAQGSAHSIIKLVRHIPVFSEVFAKLYWNVGFGAFLAFGIMCATSILPFRRRWYQLFLDIHNLLAVVTLVLCFFHVYVKFGYNWGYENWVVLAGGLWVVERLVRLIKIASHGVHTAVMTPLDEEYFEINIDGATATGYAHLYFPKGWWRLWENRPFSIASAVNPLADGTHSYTVPRDVSEAMFELGSDDGSDTASIRSDDIDGDDTGVMLKRHSRDIPMRSLPSNTHDSSPNSPTTPLNFVENVGQEKIDDEEGDAPLLPSGRQAAPSLSFLVRRQQGVTNALFHANQHRKVLVEASYPSVSTLPSLSMATAQVVCIVGGSGIAAVLPLLRARASGTAGRTVLYWGCRSEALVTASGVKSLGQAVETHVRVGQRLDVAQIVRREAHGRDDEVAVVSCGPPGMADDVRHAVVEANRRIEGKGLLRLYEECYGW